MFDTVAIKVWHYRDAPEILKAVGGHGGDEDWLALVPRGYEQPPWTHTGTSFGASYTSKHDLGELGTVYIGAHA